MGLIKDIYLTFSWGRDVISTLSAELNIICSTYKWIFDAVFQGWCNSTQTFLLVSTMRLSEFISRDIIRNHVKFIERYPSCPADFINVSIFQ